MNKIVIKKRASFSTGITIATYPDEAEPYGVADIIHLDYLRMEINRELGR